MERIVAIEESLKGDELEKAIWNLSIILGRTYKETSEAYENLEKNRQEHNTNSSLFAIIYGIGKRVMDEQSSKNNDSRYRPISGSWSTPTHIHARHICADMWRATYPHAGDLYVFRGRRGDRVKLIWHDGQGACLFTKRLERGRFLWPSVADGVVTISAAQLSYLLEGIDWRMPQKTWRPKAAG